jgi:hypothetical protein
MVHCLRALASLARDRGDVEESRRLAEQADTLRANLEMDGAFAPADLSPTHL